jgi:hypothetical protein
MRKKFDVMDCMVLRDAIAHCTIPIISKVFANADVKLTVNYWAYNEATIEFTGELNGVKVGRVVQISYEMLNDPDYYTHYIRSRLGYDMARDMVDSILRG